MKGSSGNESLLLTLNVHEGWIQLSVFLSPGVFLLFPLPFNLIINSGVAGCILSDCRLKATLIFLSSTGERVSLRNN